MTFSEFHVYASRDPNAQPVAVEECLPSAQATCRALAWKSGTEHYAIEKPLIGPNVEVFTTADFAELSDASACLALTARIETLIRETIRLEAHEEVPGEWGVWAMGGDVDGPELMGAGPSRREALEDALATAERLAPSWAKLFSRVEVSS